MTRDKLVNYARPVPRSNLCQRLGLVLTDLVVATKRASRLSGVRMPPLMDQYVSRWRGTDDRTEWWIGDNVPTRSQTVARDALQAVLDFRSTAFASHGKPQWNAHEKMRYAARVKVLVDLVSEYDKLDTLRKLAGRSIA